jgi:UDP-hydrolysing UDP-N-acetyl-D-glucosamine 2-epimerase
MGEDKKKIYTTGCPSIDILKNERLIITKHLIKKINLNKTGGHIDLTKNYLLLLYHPVTTEYSSAYKQISEIIKSVNILSKNFQILWLWPNIDAGSDVFTKQIRIFRENNKEIKNILFFKNFTPEDYAIILNNCSCVFGNSSSGIRESAYLGKASVNIGSRQNLRETSNNVMHVECSAKKIVEAVIKQNNKRYKRSFLYGNGEAGIKIARILANCELSISKKLNYIKN